MLLPVRIPPQAENTTNNICTLKNLLQRSIHARNPNHQNKSTVMRAKEIGRYSNSPHFSRVTSTFQTQLLGMTFELWPYESPTRFTKFLYHYDTIRKAVSLSSLCVDFYHHRDMTNRTHTWVSKNSKSLRAEQQ